MSYLLEYHRKCRVGEILIGQELMTQLDMLAADMDDPAYRFIPSLAEKRIRFIESECRHSISPFAGKPFLLELWEKAYLEALYGFQMEIDGVWLRRFTESLLLIGRKNGKTSLCAADGNAEFFCGNTGTNVLCASNDYEQAGLIFDEINNMREESPRLERVSRKNIKGIFMGNPRQKKKKGKFSYQNKAKIKKLSIKTGAKEGRNVDKAIIDEIHEMQDNRLVMPIWQSMSTKPEPMLNEITTEGTVQDGYLDDRLKQARKALRGEILRPRWLIWLYTQDNESEIWHDRSSWVKSNPNLGVCKQWSFLDDMVEKSKTSSATRAMMLAKDFNVKQSAAAAWLQQSEILNADTFDIADFTGGFYISGDDFAETTDLCAAKLLLRRSRDDQKIYLYSHYWIPERKLAVSPDGVDYRAWAAEGLLTIVEGNAVDTSVIADWHWSLLEQYDLKPFKCGYDNRFAKDFVRRFDKMFGEGVAVNVPQEFKCLNNPMNTLEADLRDKLVNYNNNPIDFWCFCNTGIIQDKTMRIMPCKMEKNKRIDGTAAALCAYAIYEWHRSEFLALVA